jgi:hypothetical protein
VLSWLYADGEVLQVEGPPVTPRYTYEPRTQPLSWYVVLGCTATVWLHCALSLELTAP